MDFNDWVRQLLQDPAFMPRYFMWDDDYEDEDEPEVLVVQENTDTFVNRNKIIRAIDE
ncbi:hypothetical protein Fullmetal_22 [Microbacterium phage Fullmetal]|uniref:Uncharacterized protein n=1 Tax=Microbacterium phage PhriedRice TaxID=2652407 RepID=A0A5J6T3I3_9CAUD|nr:hypothetical protein SEA_PHRIEDRICE_22 [Microbacterium phage PhriedRice]UXE04111.1 hypothetical protein Fullmetal_22 [Microbacterium phage Fullmetal]